MNEYIAGYYCRDDLHLQVTKETAEKPLYDYEITIGPRSHSKI